MCKEETKEAYYLIPTDDLFKICFLPVDEMKIQKYI